MRGVHFMKTSIPYLASVSLWAFASMTAVHGAPAAKTGHGNVKPYTLSATAMLDATGKTDVALSVNVVDARFSAPTLASHIQLKSFDTAGNLRWTKNSKDVALTPAGNVATVTQPFTDLLRAQPFNAFVQVQTAQTVNKENLEVAVAVKLRPDVTVDSITSPARIVVNQVVNFAALVRELNGDLGASARVQLRENGNVIDTVPTVAVSGRGSASAVFSALFTTPGTRTLTVTADDVNPGDYDLSNNTRSVTIEVVNDLQPAFFRASFWSYRDRDYFYEYSHWWGYGQQRIQGSEENVWMELRGLPISSTLEKVTADFGADGALNPALHFELTNLSVHDGYYYGQSYQLDAQTNLYTYVDPNNYYGTGRVVQVSRYAGDAVHYSQWHDYYWGGTSSSTTVRTGLQLRPNATFNGRLVVTINGTQHGGGVSVPLTLTPYNHTWNDYDYYNGGYYRGHDSHTQINGYTEGITTP